MSKDTQENRIARDLDAYWTKHGFSAERVEVAAVPLGDRTEVLCINFLPKRDSEVDDEYVKGMIRQMVLFVMTTGLSRKYGGVQSAVSGRVPSASAESLVLRSKYWVDAKKLRDLETKSKQDLEMRSIEDILSGSFIFPPGPIARPTQEKRGHVLPLPR
jgi:hypothetical protein